jgi:hypothetical protein
MKKADAVKHRPLKWINVVTGNLSQRKNTPHDPKKKGEASCIEEARRL